MVVKTLACSVSCRALGAVLKTRARRGLLVRVSAVGSLGPCHCLTGDTEKVICGASGVFQNARALEWLSLPIYN